jgi:hypothetical protein
MKVTTAMHSTFIGIAAVIMKHNKYIAKEKGGVTEHET